MIKRRLYVGRLLDADNELDALNRRQTMTIVRTAESYPLDFDAALKPARDWRYAAAAVCGIVLSIGFVAALVIAMVASR